MKLSAKCEYACRAVLELAVSSTPGKPLQMADIALRQQIPRKYLVQIFIVLRRMGIVGSQRGNGGGYYLLKDPSHVSIGEVVRAVDGAVLSVKCLEADRMDKCGLEGGCAFTDVWRRAREAASSVLDGVSFGKLGEELMRGRKAADYVI